MLVEHPSSVVAVALDGDDLLVVRQTRPGAGGQTLELPSGKIERGETPAQAAARELAEECGCAARTWQELGGFWAAPAYSTEFVHAFLASGLYRVDAGLVHVAVQRGVLRELADGSTLLFSWAPSRPGSVKADSNR